MKCLLVPCAWSIVLEACEIMQQVVQHGVGISSLQHPLYITH